jgi:hypothetical protein
MEHLTNKTMQLEPNGFDVNELWKWLVGASGAVAAFWKWVDSRFAAKKLEIELEKTDREEFITKVAEKAVQAALNSILGDVREDIQTLFKYREDDRKHIDQKFDKIMTEIRK